MQIRVIFPDGDRSRLAFGVMEDYEQEEYSIAGRRAFSYDANGIREAKGYGKELASKHNLPIDYSNLEEDGQNYLD